MKLNYDEFKVDNLKCIICYNNMFILYGAALYSLRRKLNITNSELLDELCGFDKNTVRKLEKLNNISNKNRVEHYIERLIKLNEKLDEIKKGKYRVINQYNSKNHNLVTLEIVRA